MKISITLSKKILPIIFWILIWQIIFLCVQKEILIVSPFSVFKNIIVLSCTSEFWLVILNSFFRILVGLILGLFIGTIVAGVNFFIKWTYYLMSPILSLIKIIPVVSFILITLVWIKGSYIPTFMAFLMVLPIAHNNVYTGMCNVNHKLLETSKVYQHSKKDILKYIYIPEVMPYFSSACTLSLGLAWKAGIAAEVISTISNSIGGKMYESKIYLETLDLFSWTAVIIILSIVFEKVFMFLLKTSNH